VSGFGSLAGLSAFKTGGSRPARRHTLLLAQKSILRMTGSGHKYAEKGLFLAEQVTLLFSADIAG